MRTLRFKPLWGDLTGGAVGALTAIPIVLSCGAVLYESMGTGFVLAGISAAFVAAVAAAIIAGLFGGPLLHVNSPKTTHAAILSGLAASVALDHSLSNGHGGQATPAVLMAVCWAALLVSGVTQMLLGLFRFGGLVRLLPLPVLAGFVNGFAIQIILNQVPRTIGLDGEAQLWAALAGKANVNVWALAFAVFTGTAAIFARRVSKRVPPALIALCVGSAAQFIAGRWVSPERLGPQIGTLPGGVSFIPHFGEIATLLRPDAASGIYAPVLLAGVTLALVSSIQSLLSISSAERLAGQRHDGNRELVVQGAGNMASAIFGGAPSGGSPNVTQTVYASGGRTSFANLAHAASLLAVSYGLGRITGWIPLSVMAGVVIVTTADAMDKWTHDLVRRINSSGSPASRRDLALNLAVVVAVAALVVFANVLVALGVGLLAAFARFLYQSSSRVVYRIGSAIHHRSRMERPHPSLEALMQYGERIAIIELQGPIYFGTAQTVERVAEQALVRADWMIFDLKRVTHFDSSGVMMLKRLDEQMRGASKHLLLAHLPRHSSVRTFLVDTGLERLQTEHRMFENIDSALLHAEDALLGELAPEHHRDREAQMREFEALRDMSDEELDRVQQLLRRQSYSEGEVLQAVEASGSVVLLAKGRVSILHGSEDSTRRIASYQAGMALSEMSLPPQAALVHTRMVAETPVVVLEFPSAELARLRTSDPALAARLLHNLAVDMAVRLHDLLDTIRRLDES